MPQWILRLISNAAGKFENPDYDFWLTYNFSKDFVQIRFACKFFQQYKYTF